ncbi:2-amino-4-hydroxy-6-hydroxymethyldihydropteridine diphosphokinase [Maridesulfovibrio ferrireducens]|uniref:2-amino-4-hydroxy-6- hydroxymethyldihydropteridine diphosphokinase n=1 Tax=Maridesulfovibrio ferrireducens TaxID=246191 RepID=UPI000B8896E6|nr:2-amino-4-hydroxy-6-hydroxymethyldihydropteridine diphosphokinase [Maridesulfovibrio ferrireducens]
MKVYVSLGSNIGDTDENLNEAVARLEKYEGIDPEVWSEIYMTEPQGLKEQAWFANQIVRFAVDPELWAPHGFLSTLQAVEGQMQRVKDQVNGPRIIDLDLILFGDETVEGGDYLTVPHSRAKERAFVLYPLAELDSELVFPDGSKIADILSKIDYRIEGKKIYQD